MPIDSLQREIEEAEARRCKALLADDLETLAALLHDDLVHVHSNGRAENRQAYLKGVAETLAFIRVDRGDLQVRGFGSVAVATGELRQLVRIRTTGAEHEMRVLTTQVWTKSDAWKLASFQATTIA